MKMIKKYVSQLSFLLQIFAFTPDVACMTIHKHIHMYTYISFPEYTLND